MNLVLAVLAIALSGGALTQRLRGWLRLPVAIAFGAGTWSATYATALLLTGHTSAVKDVILSVAAAALWVRTRRDAGTPAHRHTGTPAHRHTGTPARRHTEAPAWLWLAFAAACMLATAAVVEHTLRFPDGGYDAWMIWNTRARFLTRAADFRTAFSPRLLFWLHQDYPWLVPGLVAQSFLLGKSESLAIPAVWSGLFGALAVAAVTLFLTRLRDLRWGLLGGLALATTPCLATFSSNQQSDVPLGAFLAICAGLLALALEHRREDLLVLAGFAAGLCVWTKNEALVYLACLAGALAFRERRARAVLLFLAGAAPFLALLAGFKLVLRPVNDFAIFSTPADVLHRALSADRWGELVLLTLRRIVFFQDFALWVVAELAVLVWLWRKTPPSVLGTALFLICASYAPVYVLQPHPVEWIFRTSVNRIFIQLWPAAILATLLQVSALVKEPSPGPATART